jgi:hypothetical protein
MSRWMPEWIRRLFFSNGGKMGSEQFLPAYPSGTQSIEGSAPLDLADIVLVQIPYVG